MIHVRLKCFSIFKEAFDQENFDMEVHDGFTVGQLESKIREKLPEALKDLSFRMEVNHEFSSSQKVLQNNDEVALIPPTQGG